MTTPMLAEHNPTRTELEAAHQRIERLRDHLGSLVTRLANDCGTLDYAAAAADSRGAKETAKVLWEMANAYRLECGRASIVIRQCGHDLTKGGG